MGDEPDAEAAEAPPPPGTNKVEIHVGGHIVVVESADPLADVVGYALGVHEQTSASARRIPLGFDAGTGQYERADPYTEPTGWEYGEDERAGQLGGFAP